MNNHSENWSMHKSGNHSLDKFSKKKNEKEPIAGIDLFEYVKKKQNPVTVKLFTVNYMHIYCKNQESGQCEVAGCVVNMDQWRTIQNRSAYWVPSRCLPAFPPSRLPVKI